MPLSLGSALATPKTRGMTNFLTLIFPPHPLQPYVYFFPPLTLFPALDAHLMEKSQGKLVWVYWKSMPGSLTAGHFFSRKTLSKRLFVLISKSLVERC